MNKVSKKNIINVLLYTIGIISTGLGINVLIKSSLGAGAWDAVANNFSKFANITLGSAGAIFNIIILAFIILIFIQIYGFYFFLKSKSRIKQISCV